MKTPYFLRKRRSANERDTLCTLQEKRLRDLIDKIKNLKEDADDVENILNQKVIGDDDDDTDDVPQFNIFRKNVDEDKMALAFYEVLEHFFGNQRKEMLDGDFKNEMALAAYLFYVVVEDKFGRYDFRKNAVTPFFDFFTAKVFVEMKGTSRTFRNRVNKEMTDLELPREQKKKLMDGRHTKFETIERNYQKVRRFFHATKYGKKIAAAMKHIH